MVAINTKRDFLMDKIRQITHQASIHEANWRYVPIHECGEEIIPVPDELGINQPGEGPELQLRESVLTMLQNAAHLIQEKTKSFVVLKLLRGWASTQEQADIFWESMARFTIPEKVPHGEWKKLMQACRNSEDAFLQLPQKLQNELLDHHERYITYPYHDRTANQLHPTPHTTGGAVDVGLYDQAGKRLNLGYCSNFCVKRETFYEYRPSRIIDEMQTRDLRHRQLLVETMWEAGFVAHPNKICHFESRCTQWGTLVSNIENNRNNPAMFGLMK